VAQTRQNSKQETIMANQPSDRGQGAVKHPDSDKRLKENQSGGRSSSSTPERDEDGRFTPSDDQQQSGRGRSASQNQGSVKDPDHDGRLKQNRDQGTKKSDNR
jgi:hypothetical protein